MTTTISSFYSGILQQVMLLERYRKDISRRLKLLKDKRQRQSMIYSFLSLDLEKHQLLEHAAMVAIRTNETDVIRHLQRLYIYNGDSANLVRVIQGETRITRNFMNIILMSIRDPGRMNFSERRLAQEIEKYVMARANGYSHAHKK